MCPLNKENIITMKTIIEISYKIGIEIKILFFFCKFSLKKNTVLIQ